MNPILINSSEKYISSVKKQMASAKSSPLKYVRKTKIKKQLPLKENKMVIKK